MHIGYTGPISLKPLARYVGHSGQVPSGYIYPLGTLIVEEYLKQGHRVSIFSLDKNIKSPQCFIGDKLTIYVGPMRSPAVLRLIDFFKLEIGFLREAIAHSDCDVIQAMWSYEFALAAIEAHSKVLVTARDAPGKVLKLMPELLRLARYLIAVTVVRRSKYMSAVSPYISNYYRDRMKYEGSMTVVPNGLPRELLADRPKRFPFNVDVKILCNSSWSSLKNVKAALKGFCFAQQENPRLRLFLCGNGLGIGGKAHAWAKRRGLCQNVEFIGSLEFSKLQQLIADDIHICLHTSREESFSMAIAECMAKGIPCIGGRFSGAVPWLLHEGRAGDLVDVENIKEITEALLRLSSDNNHYDSLASAAHKRVINEFLLEDVASESLNILDEIFKSHD